jgi:hypothetical protein
MLLSTYHYSLSMSFAFTLLSSSITRLLNMSLKRTFFPHNGISGFPFVEAAKSIGNLYFSFLLFPFLKVRKD